MPRGRKKAVIEAVSIDEKIAAIETEIATLTETLKVKKAELKALIKEQKKEAKVAAKVKAAEDKKKIVEAVTSSGKSLEEVLEFLKG